MEQFKNYFNKKYEEELKEELKKNKNKQKNDDDIKKENSLMKLLKIDDVDRYMTELNFKECSGIFKPYIEFWQQNDKCTVKDFVYNILIIDAIKELPVIGMIKH